MIVTSGKYVEYEESYKQPAVQNTEGQKSGIQIFNSAPPQSSTSTPGVALTQTNTIIEKKDIDISALTKKYKDNPIEVLKELGINFSDEQIEKLGSYLTSKKRLKAFLSIVDKSNLSPDDIMAAVEKSKAFKGNNIFKRGWNVLKTAFTESFSEAKELAKSESVYYTERLSENMSVIRKEREDFSSNGLAEVADVCVQKPEIAEETMHFVRTKSAPNKHLYTEQDVLSATEFMSEKPREAETFLANAMELESIKDANGNTKYEGSTIVNVDKRMVNNKELQPTMMKTAKKHDMTDEYLDNITSNLERNPEMKGAIEYSLDAKNTDGSDRFTANSINSESNHLADKDGKYCASYTQNLQELSQYSNLNSDDIVTVANNVTSHPEIKNNVIQQIKTGNISSKEIAEYSSTSNSSQGTNTVALQTVTSNESATKNVTVDTNQQASYSPLSTNIKRQSEQQNATNPVKPFLKQQASNSDKTEEEGTMQLSFLDDSLAGEISSDNYNRMYNYFGPMTDAIIAKIKKNPDFVAVIKSCNGDKTIIQAHLNNPQLIDRILRASNVSNRELSDILSYCTNPNRTEIMLAALESGVSATQAIKTVKQSKNNNTENDALAILTSAKRNTEKQDELCQLYGVGTNREFVA